MAVSSSPTTGSPSASETRVQKVDSDVHILAPDGLKSVWDYIPQGWQERFTAKQSRVSQAIKTMRFSHPRGAALRSDTVSPKGGPPGSDPEWVKGDYLDRWDIDVAILNSPDPACYASVLASPDESVVITEAYNRYFMEQWLSADGRFKYLACVTPQDVEASVLEIERVAGNPDVVGIFLPLANTLLGNRYFHPIYRVAEKHSLPIFVHVSGPEFIYQGSTVPCGGFPESYSERRATFSQVAEVNLASLLFTGTLERFPELQFCFSEFGFTWALSLLWRFDDNWRHTRAETPWLKKPPSEYVRDRIRLTTQPIDEPENPKHVQHLIDMLGDDILLFSTDYPHWDNDNPIRVLQQFSEERRKRICWENPSAFWKRV